MESLSLAFLMPYCGQRVDRRFSSSKRCQPFGDEEQVTFHQPHRNGFGDGGEGADADGVGNRSLLAPLLLLAFALGSSATFCERCLG